MSRRHLLIFAVLSLTACGPKPVGMGTVKLTYSTTSAVKTSANLKDPLLGTVYGNVFLQEDVGVFGPRNGAEEFAAVEVAGVDLRTADPSAESFTSMSLAAGSYVFLGFFDVDGNGSMTKDPDPGDPVTQALTNKFEITDATQTELVVKFDLVLN